MLVEFGVGSEELAFRSVLERFSKDSHRIVIIHDHDILISVAGRYQETSSLIRINLSSDLDCLGIH
jgi:hypothetical protein